MDESTEHYKKINFIDGIAWINLDRSTERKKHMKNVLKNIDVPKMRISAIDGKNEDVTTYFSTIDQKKQTLNYLEIACTLSHLKTINQLKTKKGDYFLVLEDDVVFDNMKYIPYDLKTIIQCCPEFDVLQLYKTNYYPFHFVDVYQNWADQPSWGACAYIISRSGINKITEKFKFENNILQNKLSECCVSENVIYNNSNTYTYKYNCVEGLEQESIIHNEKINIHKASNQYNKNVIFNDFGIN